MFLFWLGFVHALKVSESNALSFRFGMTGGQVNYDGFHCWVNYPLKTVLLCGLNELCGMTAIFQLPF